MDQVRQVFNGLSNNHNDLITRDTLLRFLDRQGRQLYDRQIFEQLYQRVPKGKNGMITIQDFTIVMQEALETLKQKINTVQQTLQDKNLQLGKVSQNLQTVASTERFNDHNISLQSKIQITILGAEILFPGYSNLYFIVGCDQQRKQTKFASRINPVWNEGIELDIRTGQEQIWIILLDEELQRMQEIGGQAQLELMEFQDQKKKEIVIELKDKQGVVLMAKVHIIVQWIHDQTKYFEEQIADLQHEIQELQFDNDEYRKDVRAIVQPFDHSLQQNEPPEEAIITLARSTDQVDEKNQYLNITLFATLFYIFLALLISLFKVEFLDFLVLFYILIFLRNNIKLVSLLHIKIILVLLVLSLIYDIAWLIIYTKNWVSNIRMFDQENTLREFEVILMYILLGFKLVLIFIFAKLYQLNPDKREDILDEQYYQFFRPFDKIMKTVKPAGVKNISPSSLTPITATSQYLTQPATRSIQQPYYQTFQPQYY